MIIPLLFCLLAVANGESIQVRTVEGTIEGYAAADGDYYAFHGIPYAMSREGSDMFKPSTPPSALPGLFHAYNSDIQCARPSPSGMVGIINCLVLNVFTSNVTATKPVVVWLNGEESNPTVSAQHSFKRFIDNDVVVVTMNYRLSVYGFLCLRTEQNPGNAGLKDIILGLQWIQRNIAVFGGDPNNVVLMGHGSAAAMVELITLTPQSESLVHKAIAFSGSAMSPWAVTYDPIGAAITLNRVIGGGLQSIDDITIFLSSRSLSDVNNALNQFKYTNNTPMFAPCIENADLEGALLTDAPINLLRAAIPSKDMPYLAGYVTKEGTIRAAEAMSDRWLEKMQANFTDFLPVDLDFGNDMASQVENIRNFYFPSGINMGSIERYLDYHGDTMVVVPIIRALRERLSTSVSDLWLLEMGYMGTNNSDWDLDQIPINGARHGSILNYIFDIDLTYEYDKIVAETLVNRITAFAYTGAPDEGTWIRPVPFTLERFNYLEYSGYAGPASAQLSQINRVNPQNETMAFWDPLYDSFYSAPSSAVALTGLLSIVLFSFFGLILA